MEKANDRGTPRVVYKIKMTPEQLDTIKQRVVTAIKSAQPGQEVLYELTPMITLEFDTLAPKYLTYPTVESIT